MQLNTLFLILLILLVGVLALIIPSSALVTLLIVAAIAVLGVIAYLLLQSLRSILLWINGKPIGQPGQTISGVDRWIKGVTFAMGGSAGLSDPDPSKPTDPPPPDI